MDKKAYQEKLEAQLKEWQADIDKLKAQAKGKSADAKIAYQEKAKQMEQKMAYSREKLNVLKETADDKWEDVKKELEKETNEIKAQLKDIFS